MSSSKRPRIVDVARLAGVSEGTVSVVLNNRVGENVRVSKQTQQKIWDVVRELGYVANPVAQSLAGGQNRIIAIFTFESIFPIDSRSFYYPFLIGIEEEADIQGYDLLLVTGSIGSENGARRIYQNGVNRLQRADGAILLGHGDRTEVERLLQDDFPFVFVGRRDSKHDQISYVSADYTTATLEVMQYLRQNGHVKTAYVRSTRDTEASAERETGVRKGLEQPSAQDWLWRTTPADITAEKITTYLNKGFTAFVVEDDELGHRLLNVSQSCGLQCPDDFSLAVLGNPLNPMIDVPEWTSFNIPRREMGHEAFNLLLERLQHAHGDNVFPLRKQLTCTFNAGKTVRRV
ncbi:MAG: LacI family DNA-binding transcriptional regulator [Chloroflexota bacterium]